MMRWSLALLVSLTLIGVAAAQPTPAAVKDQSAPIVDSAKDYRLGAGDRLKINVFGEETLSGEFIVSGGAGSIAFPLIGDVPALGLTVSDLKAEIEGKLKPDYLKDPKVSIEVLTYRPYYIMGEVGHPGEYPYKNGLTVLNAVATANGFTYRANTHNVYIKRAGGVKEVESRLDASTVVEPGDTIRIGERFF
jgi:protein involved in polysaccharide export with SLBB domain